MELRRALHRLRYGPRWWAAEIAFRLCGLIALISATELGLRLRQALTIPGANPGGRLFLIATGAVLCLWAGLGLTIAGPGLWRIQPVPPRAWLPVHGLRQRR